MGGWALNRSLRWSVEEQLLVLGEQRSSLGPRVGHQEGGVVGVGLEEELVCGVLRVERKRGGSFWLCALARTTDD